MYTSRANSDPLVHKPAACDETPPQQGGEAILEDALNGLEQYCSEPMAQSRWKVAQCIALLLNQRVQAKAGVLDLRECKSDDIKALPPAVIKALAPRVSTLLLTGTPPDWVKELARLANLTIFNPPGPSPVLDLTSLSPRLERVHINDATQLQAVHVRQGVRVMCEQPPGAGQKISVEHYDDSGRRLHKETAASNRAYSARMAKEYLNGKARFPDGTEINCSALAPYWARRRAEWKMAKAKEGLSGTFQYADVAASPKILAANVKLEDGALLQTLMTEAPENIGFENSQFGRCLSHLFREMAGKGPKGPSTLHAILLTPFPMEGDKRNENHAMTIELSIKPADGKPVYTLSFYDPNDTVNHQRNVAHDPQQVEQWQLQDLIDPDWMELYYDNSDFSSLLVMPGPGSSKTEGTRTTRFFFDDARPTPPAILQQAFQFILRAGLAEAMPALQDRIAALPERFAVLTAKTCDGWQGVPLAIALKDAQVITALGAMLERLGNERRLTQLEIAKLWTATTPGGSPSLAEACSQDDVQVIAAAGVVTEKLGRAKLLAPAQIFEWLSATTSEGVRCLAVAFNWGKPETITAAGNMVIRLKQAGLLSSDQAAELWKAEATELWKANTGEGWIGAETVSLRGDAEIIAAYEAVRKRLGHPA